MTRLPDGERIAVLENEMEHLVKQLGTMDLKLDTVVKTLDEMSGGKKVVLGIFTLIGSAVGVFGTLFGLHLFGK